MQKLEIIFPKVEEIPGKKDTRFIHDASDRFLFVADEMQSKTLA
jgi:hypothetical protein